MLEEMPFKIHKEENVMKREIKFRAWDKDRKVMDYFDDLYWFEEEGVHDSNRSGHHAEYEIMQYIGLKDKNGKEIYEGDRIKIHDSDVYGGLITDVIFSTDGHHCGYIGRSPTINLGAWHNSVEIIGNIYENPELLEKSK